MKEAFCISNNSPLTPKCNEAYYKHCVKPLYPGNSPVVIKTGELDEDDIKWEKLTDDTKGYLKTLYHGVLSFTHISPSGTTLAEEKSKKALQTSVNL